MGLFGSKTRTTINTYNSTSIRHKIVKFSYLQTLAVTGGLGSVTDLAGQTEASSVDTKDSNTSKDKRVEALSKAVSFLSFDIAGTLGNLVSSLFGRKETKDINTKVEDSGWRVINSWLEPEFDKIRYAMGIRELTVARFRYEVVSEVVSIPWASPKEISKVSLIADEFIPEVFPSETHWIEYYVKPEIKNADWIRINPVGKITAYSEDGKIIPRIVNFNSERPATARLEESFVNLDSPVKEVRLKAILKRPTQIEDAETTADAYSPILKSYRLMMFPRGGL